MLKNIDKKFWLNSSIILGIFLVLAFGIGMSQSVWFDEAYSVEIAKKPVSELISLTAIDVHPPLYYLVLKGWGMIFGFSELAIRSISIIMMALMIVLMMNLVKKLAGGKAASITGFILAISPMIIRYGFEVRMYAMATLISVLASLILWKIIESKKPNLKLEISYAVLIALGMLTLYYTIVVWLSQLIYLIYKTIKSKNSLTKQRFWLYYILAIILFSPWLITAIRQFSNGALAPISEPLHIVNLIGVVSFNFLYKPAWQLSQVESLIVIGVLVLIGLMIYKTSRKKIEEGLVYLGYLAVMPLVIQFSICLIKPMYVERYLMFAAPFMLSLVAIMLGKIKIWQQFLIILALGVGVFNLTQVGNFNFQRMQKPDVKEMANHLKLTEAKILTDSPYEAIELKYYIGENYFYAPYQSLGGGYAPLDKSPLKVFDFAEIKDEKCIIYTFYQDNLGEKLADLGFKKTEKIRENKGGLKAIKFCR